HAPGDGLMPAATLPIDPIWWSVFGLAVALLGLAWAGVAGCLRPARRWLAALGVTCLAGLGGAAAWVSGYPASFWQPLLALVPVMLVLTLVNSGLPRRLGSR